MENKLVVVDGGFPRPERRRTDTASNNQVYQAGTIDDFIDGTIVNYRDGA